ncbi:MAG: hypothetical protein IT245_00310 [Bacteroidia bacterium]|nr:hypothetical protein [Bacteroidia bacterium]
MRRLLKYTSLCLFALIISLSVPSCKAKSCDVDNNVADNGSSKRKKKNMGLFSKKENRRRHWR